MQQLSVEQQFNMLNPLDGRYYSSTHMLRHIFSERGFTLYRIKVEILYLIKLLDTVDPTIREHDDYPLLLQQLCFLYSDLNFDVVNVKSIEDKIKHDVKSVEYYIKERLSGFKGVSPDVVARVKPLVHFGLTSQDITTVSLWMQLKDTNHELNLQIKDIIKILREFFNNFKGVAIISRTHGQIATPTTFGKEFMVFAERLHYQLLQLNGTLSSSRIKFGGCIGNFNAHVVAYPNVDWLDFADSFIKEVGFNQRAQYTTQIDHYDMMCAYFDCVKRVNTILLDMCRDIWEYISHDQLVLKINAEEVGSSTMPHKVNPIDFENAEGNLQLGNSMFELFSRKLPVSRLQRDLSDSTVTRNFGVAFGYTLLAYRNIQKGLRKISPNIRHLRAEINDNYVVVGEALQSILKSQGIDNGYEILKQFTRQYTKPTKDEFLQFIDTLDVSDDVKQRMKVLSPPFYTGVFPKDYK